MNPEFSSRAIFDFQLPVRSETDLQLRISFQSQSEILSVATYHDLYFASLLIFVVRPGKCASAEFGCLTALCRYVMNISRHDRGKKVFSHGNLKNAYARSYFTQTIYNSKSDEIPSELTVKEQNVECRLRH